MQKVRVTRLAVRLGGARALVLGMAVASICLLCSGSGAVALASSTRVPTRAPQAQSTAFQVTGLQLTGTPFARPGATTERSDANTPCQVYAAIEAVANCLGVSPHFAYVLCYGTQYSIAYISCTRG